MIDCQQSFLIKSSFVFSRFPICFHYWNLVETLVSWFLSNDNNLFRALRCDRLYDRVGGVCVTYKTSIAPMIFRFKINTINFPGFEIIAFNFHYSKSKFSRLICTYLPPSKVNDEVTTKALMKVLKSLVCLELYILKDFNFRGRILPPSIPELVEDITSTISKSCYTYDSSDKSKKLI